MVPSLKGLNEGTKTTGPDNKIFQTGSTTLGSLSWWGVPRPGVLRPGHMLFEQIWGHAVHSGWDLSSSTCLDWIFYIPNPRSWTKAQSLVLFQLTLKKKEKKGKRQFVFFAWINWLFPALLSAAIARAPNARHKSKAQLSSTLFYLIILGIHLFFFTYLAQPTAALGTVFLGYRSF